MEQNDDLMSFSQALELLKQGQPVARLGWTLDGKCWEYQPATETEGPDGPRPLAETIVMRYSNGTWGPPEFSVRSLLANDWFVGRSGDRRRPGQS
jgi:hypothetical protein